MMWLLDNLFRSTGRLAVEDQGTTTTEYAIILGLVLVAVISGAALFGVHITGATSAVSTGLGTSADPFVGSFGPGPLRSPTTVSHP